MRAVHGWATVLLFAGWSGDVHGHWLTDVDRPPVLRVVETKPASATIEVGTRRLTWSAPSQASWATLERRFASGGRFAVMVAQLDAPALREQVLGARWTWTDAWLRTRLETYGHRTEVHSVGRLDRGWLHVAVGVPVDDLTFEVGAQQGTHTAGRATRHWALRWERPAWAFALIRRTSRYGGPNRWHLGSEVRVSSALALASRLGEEQVDLGLRVGAHRWWLRVTAPVVSPIAAGVSVAVGWSP